MKKLLLLMLVALTAVSGAKAEAGDAVDWYLYFYKSEASYTGDKGQFKETSTENLYSLENVEVTESGFNFCVHNNAWTTKYGYKNSGVDATWTATALAVFTTNDVTGWLNIHSGTYTVLLDMTNTTYPTIEFQPVLTIDEDSEGAPSITADNYNLTVKRTLKADTWQTICLPVWLNISGTEFLVNTYFGEGTIVAELSNNTDNTLNFTTVSTNIDYNKPYLIKPTANKTSINFGKIWVNAYSPVDVITNDYTFTGTNKKITLSSGEYYLAGGNLHQQKSTNTTIKGTRAYFTTGGSTPARELKFTVDGVVTDIHQVVMPEAKTTGVYYNLEGQNMGTSYENLPAGMYIINNKKIVKQ